ncbi:MAG: hypothetical protein Q8P67_08370 [archaeon]|nr:hypothetical protein [archaeon]
MPPIIRRYFGQIRESDQQCRDLLGKIDAESRAYLNSLRKVRKDPTASAEQLAAVREKYNQAIKLSDAKIELASSTYRLIDNAIQKLDADLKKFEAELSAQAGEAGSSASATQIADIISTAGASAGQSNKKRGRNLKTPGTSGSTTLGPQKRMTATMQRRRTSDGADADMPIDPDEPVYCICDRVSFGEMVCCDRSDCATEWFHFECVGLTQAPKGTWICPDCRNR